MKRKKKRNENVDLDHVQTAIAVAAKQKDTAVTKTSGSDKGTRLSISFSVQLSHKYFVKALGWRVRGHFSVQRHNGGTLFQRTGTSGSVRSLPIVSVSFVVRRYLQYDLSNVSVDRQRHGSGTAAVGAARNL